MKYEINVDKCRRLLNYDDEIIEDDHLPSFWLKLTTFLICQQ